MVLREQSRADRREVAVQLTEKGREAMARMERVLLQSLAALLDELGPDYAARWCDVARQIRSVLTAENPRADAARSVR